MAFEGVAEMLEEGDVAAGAGSEVAVATLGGNREMTGTIPDEQSFA